MKIQILTRRRYDTCPRRSKIVDQCTSDCSPTPETKTELKNHLSKKNGKKETHAIYFDVKKKS